MAHGRWQVKLLIVLVSQGFQSALQTSDLTVQVTHVLAQRFQ